MTDAAPSDLFPYPRGYVVAILADGAACADARERLEQAGFAPGTHQVLHGEEGLARIDLDGQAHGTSGTIMRRLQSALTDDADHARRYADALRDGHYVIGVQVGEDEAAKQRAAEALRGAQDLDFYAENYVEDLRA